MGTRGRTTVDEPDSHVRDVFPKLDLKPHRLPGVLATFDGVDGSGKSTTIHTLQAILAEHELPTEQVKMPSPPARGLPYFKEFTDDYRSGEDGRVDPTAVCLVLLSDRLLTVRRQIMPLLARGYWVLCDRYIYMTFAQMGSYGCSLRDLDALVAVGELFPRPDLPCITDLDPREAIRRIRERPGEDNPLPDAHFYDRFVLNLRKVALANSMHLVHTRSKVETCEQIRGLAMDIIRGRQFDAQPQGFTTSHRGESLGLG